MVCPKRLCCSLGVISFPCHKEIINQSCPSWNKVIARERKRLNAKETDVKMEAGTPCILFSCS
jgi:hypothetical protein